MSPAPSPRRPLARTRLFNHEFIYEANTHALLVITPDHVTLRKLLVTKWLFELFFAARLGPADHKQEQNRWMQNGAMIDLALDLVCTRLNAHLSALYSAPEDLVVLAPLTDAEGRPTAQTRNRLALFLTNISEDSVSRASPAAARGPMGGKRPIHIDLYFMLASGHDPEIYAEGLKLISTALMFFQANSVMTPARVPEMPKGLSQLSFEIANLRVEEVSQMWGVLGGRYVPSVMFKMRSVMIDAGDVSHVTPLIRTPQETTRPGGAA